MNSKTNKMKQIVLSFLVMAMSIGMYAQVDLITWGFNSAGNYEGWTAGPGVSASLPGGGTLFLTAANTDPYIYSPLGNMSSTIHTHVKIRMRNNTSSTTGQIFFTTNTVTNFTGGASETFTTSTGAGFVDYIIPMDINPLWTGTITQIRIDMGVETGTYDIDYIKILGDDCTPQIINFAVINDKLVSDGGFNVSAISDSGLSVQYSLISGPATIFGSFVSLTGDPGFVVLAANQAGDGTHCVAEETTQSFYVKEAGAPTVSPQITTEADQWVATDALNRELSQHVDVGNTKVDKYVGIFYFLWHGNENTPQINDITKLIAANPSNPAYGPLYEFHWWGESEDGYFRADDRWVIRRQLEMLSAAAVDFLYIDVTNNKNYLPTVDILCQVSQEMRSKGIKTPYITFVTKTKSGENLNKLYDNFYALEKYKDLWFIWDGKPLIFGIEEDPTLRAEVSNYFSIRYSWFDTDTPAQPYHWQELDTYPQDYGHDNVINKTQMPVAKALFPIHAYEYGGDSYRNSTGGQPTLDAFKLTPDTGKGNLFSEQFQWAIDNDPQVIMITGWNEWMVQRQVSPGPELHFLGQPTANGDAYFTDSYNQEFNRDIAPMKGGHTDNHYYLMIDYIRKFKGMEAPADFSASKSITIDGVFTEWQTVLPVFRDHEGDVEHRNHASFANTFTYTNTTGRNDIIESRSVYDSSNIYFYVKTVDPLTTHTDPNWMLLFIDADQDKSTGWEGYDYVINNGINSSTQTTLKQWNVSSWGSSQNISYNKSGNEMEISIPRSALGLDSGTPEFYFHWADNPPNLIDISAFFTDGDSAPSRRFNYNYTPSATAGIGKNTFDKNPIIYPNPAKNSINILSNGNAIEKVVIYDMLGRVIYDDNELFTDRKSIQVSPSWNSGIVFVKLIGEKGVSTQKLIIE